VLDILAKHGVKKVVKSKSMLTEECHLNPYLEQHGIEVVDTDLGERIVQLRKEPPSHIVLPAIHLKKEEIGETFHEHRGTPAGEEDPDALTMTVKLHQGVKFHDGTELTAEVAKWNYDLAAPTGKLQFADSIKEIEIVDNYTYVIHLNYWHNLLLQSLGWVPMFSKEAYEKSGATEEAGMSKALRWSRTMSRNFRDSQATPIFWDGVRRARLMIESRVGATATWRILGFSSG
jgi:hypothetical protein